MKGYHPDKQHSTAKMECFFLFLFLSSFASPAIARNQRVVYLASENQNQTSQLHTYIVHVHQKSATTSFSTDYEREEWHKSFLPASTASGEGGSSRLVYSYKCVIAGFAARLTPDELAEMKRKPGFVHAYADSHLSPATTRSPAFLCLHRYTAGLWNDSGYGRGVIIGVLDTGISPDHPSFSDGGVLPPPPARWKGACEFNASDCNNKLIGARSFLKGSDAMRGPSSFGQPEQGPYDYEGHGTHAAGTAAGMFVDGASVEGQAYGTASGIAPYAYLAIYKVCQHRDWICMSSDLLAGIDAAVHDGVDVLSISFQPFRLPLFSSQEADLPFYSDPIAIGTFHAIEKGVFVSAAAGNDGPSLSSLENGAPWILTAGAGSIDRSVRTTVRLGSGDEFDGESIYQPGSYTSPSLPLVHLGGTAASAYCLNGSFDSFDVKGRIVLCDDPGYSTTAETGLVVKAAGGAGMVIASTRRDRYVPIPDVAHALPASHVSYSDGLTIKEYIRAAGGAATASICFKGTVLGTSPAPVVADFSSRGPSRGDPNVLKPDIVGPGADILAAWPWPSRAGGPSPAFNIVSGTSVAAAHLSGVAAILKNLHPDWSAAAIKSAIMTTAEATANDGNPITDQTTRPTNFFALGSGHVNVTKASNPGLVYDIAPGDYVRYLCGLDYTSDQLAAVTGRYVDCSHVTAVAGSSGLNYPSFSVTLTADNGYTAVVSRTVTNVGAPSSAYAARVKSPLGASVAVSPESLYFSRADGKAQFSVTFTGIVGIRGVASYSEGCLAWVSADNNTVVNSPIMVSVG